MSSENQQKEDENDWRLHVCKIFRRYVGKSAQWWKCSEQSSENRPLIVRWGRRWQRPRKLTTFLNKSPLKLITLSNIWIVRECFLFICLICQFSRIQFILITFMSSFHLFLQIRNLTWIQKKHHCTFLQTKLKWIEALETKMNPTAEIFSQVEAEMMLFGTSRQSRTSKEKKTLLTENLMSEVGPKKGAPSMRKGHRYLEIK